MASDFDGLRRDQLGRRQDAQFDFQLRRFGKGYWSKPRVFESRRPRGICHSAVDGAHRQNVADASPQLATEIKSSERSPRLRKVFGGRVERNFALLQRRKDRVVGQAKHLTAFFLRELSPAELSG